MTEVMQRVQCGVLKFHSAGTEINIQAVPAWIFLKDSWIFISVRNAKISKAGEELVDLHEAIKS